MSVATHSVSVSRVVAILGSLFGVVGSFGYFVSGSATLSGVGLSLSVLGLALGVIALLLRPRSVVLGVVALFLSSPAIAYVAVGKALGIQC